VSKPLVILAYPKIDHEKDYVYFWMPFSLLTVARALLEDGVEVVLFDGNRSPAAEWEAFLDEYLGRAACVGLSVMTGGGQIGHALELARAARARPGCPPLVFGGPHINVLAEQTLEHPLVGAVLVGPGQNSMPACVRALLGRGALDAVPGLLAKAGGRLVRGPDNPPRAGSLGRYPWHLLPVEHYIRNDPTVAPRTLNYVSSQGCAYRCRFCYELTYRRKYSALEAADLLADVEDLVARYPIDGVKFYDADWFINLGRAEAFCRGLIERGLGLRWAASINPNDVRRARRGHPDLLPLLAQSGCTRLLMGVESGSDRVLRDVVHKEITRAEILEVAREIAAHGILGSYTFIVGFPGETEAEQEETFGLVEELRTLHPRPETRVHVFAPYPGTPLFEEAGRQGFVPPTSLEGWSGYDYYESQTPWTGPETVRRARAHTHMRLSPHANREC
jgi:radical SAM superfamily enzyme YgiQ (UPF0313 family)